MLKYIILFLLSFSLLGVYKTVRTPKGKKRKIRVVKDFKKIYLVNILDYIPDAVVDLKYHKRYSLFKKRVYKENICFVKKSLAKRLKRADKILRRRYKKKIKFLDCYRPWSIQKKKWRYFPNKKYVDHPYYGSKHNRGAAVDITLVTLKGKRVKMPTRFDYFSKKASRNYKRLPKKVKKNRDILKRVMARVGLIGSKRKWWHYSLRYVKRYPILDISLRDYFIAKEESDKRKMFNNNKRKNRETSSFSFKSNKKNKNRDFDKEIKSGIDSKKAKITNCFIKEYNRVGKLPKKLLISYTIRQNGRVYDVMIQHPKYKNKQDKLNYCVLKVFNEIKFKRFPRSTIGQMPLEFSFE